MGEPNEVKPGKGEFHENPLFCICEKVDPTASGDSGSHTWATIRHEIVRENSLRRDTGSGGVTDEQFAEDEQDGYDTDDADNENGLQGKSLPNKTDSYLGVLKGDPPELEEMFSNS
ncbi:O-fucosyltransferase family protein [Actinidia rufa]|uniref:O-fucosyltransferase family protein n=1 Tax=Actinidia rufa TaxID=165716 RepID=A0A7J0F730_9ERIC|nr:O-fucosyltransferase family protein [Actinidia rufa]